MEKAAPLLPQLDGMSEQQVRVASYTLNALKRWSVTNNELPSVERIKHLHIYDFDNTLFNSPLPNKQLWHVSSIGTLQGESLFISGGWWHDPGVLGCTGEGVAKEEPRAWEGWWNEDIVKLVRLSMEQPDALTVLLTGRAETTFSGLVQRILRSKKLQFDLICLKPEVGPSNQRFSSTGQFKEVFLFDLVQTYNAATDLRIYEDRPKHAITFRTFFTQLNEKLSNGILRDSHRTQKLNAEVIDVAPGITTLDPVVEATQIQNMINAHNAAIRDGKAPSHHPYKPWEIKRSVIYTGYMVSPADTKRILEATKIDSGNENMRFLCNTILISPRPAPKITLGKIGGMGAKQRWRLNGLGKLDNRVWAARVMPVPAKQVVTENVPPRIVLALRGTASPHDAARISQWTPLSDEAGIEFDTVVGEKALLRLEQEQPPQMNTPGKRPMVDDKEHFPTLPTASNQARSSKGLANGTSAITNGSRSPRGGASIPHGPRGEFRRGSGRGGRGQSASSHRGGTRGRGRGGYRSLDDDRPGRGGGGMGLDGADDDNVGMNY